MNESDSSSSLQRLSSYLFSSVLSPRIAKFAIVGASGVIVNMGVLYALTEFARLPYFVSSVLAIELSILSNFTVNLLWTWRDRAGEGTMWGKMVRYHVGAGATAFLGNYLILLLLTEVVGMHYLVSNLIGIGIGTIANYLINDLWTFRRRKE